jgi:hypothetical protein
MAGIYKLEIQESAEELKQLLRIQVTARSKEHIQLLYLLQTQQAKTVQTAAGKPISTALSTENGNLGVL